MDESKIQRKEESLSNRGFRVAAFMDFEVAINWLMTSTELKSE